MGTTTFSLYLRAFQTTNAVVKNMSSHHVLSSTRIDRTADFDVERVISEAIDNRGWGPLIALGKRGEHVGAGRIESTEETWQNDVALLAASAHTIVLVPAPNNGTLWEVDLILKNRYLHKTVFVLLPMSHFDYLSKINLDEFVSKARLACALGPGVILPNARNGLVFSLADNGTLRKAYGLPRVKVDDWESTLFSCRYGF